MQASWDGLKIRCIVSDRNGKSVTSNEVTLSLSQGVMITKQPESAKSSGYGKPITVSITAVGNNLTYGWEYKLANSNTWNRFQTGNGKSSISVPMTDASYEGIKVRCLVTGDNGANVMSSIATLGFK